MKLILRMLLFAWLLFGTSPILSNQSEQFDAMLVGYLATISKYTSIEFQSKRYSKLESPVSGRSTLEGYTLVDEYSGIHVFQPTGYRYTQRVYSWGNSGVGKWLERQRSWRKGVNQEFIDPLSTEITSNPRKVAGGGAILEMAEDVSQFPQSPWPMLGFYATSGSGKDVHLHDLILKKPPKKISENGFLIENIWDWDAKFGYSYDLEFELSSKFDFLPEKITVWDRTLADVSRTVLFERRVNKFAKIDGLFIPVDYSWVRQVDDTRSIIEVKAINREYSDADFELEFPPNHWHVDARTGTKYVNGKAVGKLSMTPSGEPNMAEVSEKRSLWVWLGLVVGMVVLASTCAKIVRNAGFVCSFVVPFLRAAHLRNVLKSLLLNEFKFQLLQSELKAN